MGCFDSRSGWVKYADADFAKAAGLVVGK